MNKLTTLEDLFFHELRDLYSAELQLIDALPAMIHKAGSGDLKEILEHHLKETRMHKERLEEISNDLNVKIDGETSEAMKGLIKSASLFMDENANESVMDAGIIADAQRIEHYEIAGYGSVIEHAKQIGKNNVAERLQITLDQEKSADLKLTTLAKRGINQEAGV